MKTLFTLLVTVFVLIGCEYTQSLCSNARKDVGLEGKYRVHYYDHSKFMAVDAEASIDRVDTGLYSGAGLIVHTCELAGRILAESKDTETSTFQVQFIQKIGNTIEFIPAVFDQKELDAKKIPYSVVDRGASQLSWMRWVSNVRGIKALVIDNKNIAPDMIAAALHPIAIKYYFEKNTAATPSY